MAIRILNGFSCNARWPSRLRTGTVCILCETDQGLVLVDTGPGTQDYIHPHLIMRLFRIMFSLPFDPQQAVVHQVRELGIKPEEIHHIVLTHMHFDHCGGLPDFLHARVHVHRRELAAFMGRVHRWTDMAYIQRHIDHSPDWVAYDDGDESWYGYKAIRLPFRPEMWLVSLHGHSRGHCGVAIRLKDGWFFNAADAGAVYNETTPAWLIRLVLGPHDQQLRQFMRSHPEVLMVNSHMWVDWFSDYVRLD